MPDANGVTAHRLEDLERRMDHTLTREVFEARMGGLAQQIDALHADLNRERERREKAAEAAQRAENNRRNAIGGALIAAGLSLLGTLALAVMSLLQPGQVPSP